MNSAISVFKSFSGSLGLQTAHVGASPPGSGESQTALPAAVFMVARYLRLRICVIRGAPPLLLSLESVRETRAFGLPTSVCNHDRFQCC